jgi:hypothetical protein
VENWTQTPYQGQLGTFFVDVTGDGRADAIAVNAGNITVRRSNGRAFGAIETWSTTAYFGALGTYFADVDGNGRADAIAVHSNRITVRRSTGSTFGVSEIWAIELDGPSGLYFEDINSDNRADVIVVNESEVSVRPSTGSVQTGGFGATVQLLRSTFVGELGTYVADVTGDGQADFLASRGTGMTIRRRRPYW